MRTITIALSQFLPVGDPGGNALTVCRVLRDAAERGAELLLMPYASAMSGERCRAHWTVHLPARASDNGAFVAACNLPFPAKNGVPRGGGMAVFDPKGSSIASYYGAEEHTLLCTLSGPLPRELPPGDMHHISYFDRKRTELFRSAARPGII